MDVTQWYAIILGGLFALPIVTFLLIIILKKTSKFAEFYFLRYVYYSQVYKQIRGSEKTTWFDVGLICVFLVGVILCTTFQVKDVSTLARRSGLISIINLIPLSLGSHMNLIASWCGISLGTYSRVHRWLGRVAILEGFIHMAAIVALKQSLRNITGLSAAIILAIVLLSSVATIRRRVYEIFRWLHLVISALLIVATYLHTRSSELLTPPTVYLLAAICLQMFMWALWIGNVLYRNVKYKSVSRVSVQTITFKKRSRDIPVSDAVHVHVRLARPWQHRPGQYAYLCIPWVNLGQSHPFYVSWWYHDQGNDYIVFIVQKRKGFTKNLFAYATNDLTQDSGWGLVEGPYGKELNLESYGTVLLFATGIGIAGQLPYVAQLLERYQNCEVRTRRIALFWELESELDTAWVADMMKKLLLKDTDRILDIQLFVVGQFLSDETREGDKTQLGERINITYQVMDPESLIKSEIEGRKGRMVVSLCTNNEMGEKIRRIVLRMLENDIHLEEIDFRPASVRKNFRVATNMFNARDLEG